MSDDRPYPTLAHAMAALDELPIAGAMRIPGDRPGVDYDALVRARRLLPYLWPEEENGVRLAGVALTPQGGVALAWSRPDARFDITVDPFSLYACRLDTARITREWTRATIDGAVADARASLGLPPLAAPAQGPALGAASVRASVGR